ncbi:hypothetical protein BH24ACT3_BH24ACT3_10760 [soil metagenome]
MNASETAAVIVAVASVVAVTLLVVAMVALVRTLRSLRDTVEALRAETLPVVRELHATVARANGELERVDDLLVSAESVTATVDSASRLLYLALSNPVIKVLAFASGTSRAARRLRRVQ